MSFTSDIKKEIVSRGIGDGTDDGSGAKRAGISAFVRTSGALGVKDGAPAFFLVSETEHVAEFFMRLFFETFKTELSVTHASMDRKSGRDKLVLQCPPAFSRNGFSGGYLPYPRQDGGTQDRLYQRRVLGGRQLHVAEPKQRRVSS